MNKIGLKKHMENTWLSGFTIKVNRGTYEVCTAFKMGHLVN